MFFIPLQHKNDGKRLQVMTLNKLLFGTLDFRKTVFHECYCNKRKAKLKNSGTKSSKQSIHRDLTVRVFIQKSALQIRPNQWKCAANEIKKRNLF